jgi:very-short-patch-repair endonuclease
VASRPGPTRGADRSDLLRLGFPEKAIKHRVATGRLHPVAAGVYAVGRRELSPDGRWMVAVLACGEGAVLSHQSAAALWAFGWEASGPVHVTIPRRSGLKRPGMKVHCRPKLQTRSVTRWRGIPVTDPVQTLIDIAPELTELRLERCVNQADVHDLIDPETLRASLDAHRGELGVKKLATLLDRHTFRLSDSDLEVLFRALVLAARLPLPLTKHMLLGFETDFFFPDLDLVVETDGLRYHRTPAQQARAAKRDQKHVAAGYRVLRFTHWQIAHAPNEVTAILQAIPAAATARPGRDRDRPSPAPT